ncbi:hypothetical protein AC578_9412 [Pseudocercospora eumusae]|uniref:AT hook domain-containing protein family protein n=1 Tax=Pseudocercospora eumusae TaxID=321146 RepID=A0A139H6Q4_9PEZI|nr:hypothetical protein AC578_9412 [Pseudocercospora eumusae]
MRTTRLQAPNLAVIELTQEREEKPAPPSLVRKSTSLGHFIEYLNEEELNTELQRLPRKELQLVRLKQRQLQDPSAQVPDFIRQTTPITVPQTLLTQAVIRTFVFAGESAGTAVCVSPAGLLLTCSHCVAESRAELKSKSRSWLLTSNGQPVQASCAAWDHKRDLALLQIVTAPSLFTRDGFSFFANLCLCSQAYRSTTLRSEDTEAATSGLPTGYDVLHISDGRFRGLAPGQDVQDNSDIGALQHDCWTYWGHSGAPLIEKVSGKLIGLHSSWDDQTGMRCRGIALQAIQEFLAEHCTAVTSRVS